MPLRSGPVDPLECRIRAYVQIGLVVADLENCFMRGAEQVLIRAKVRFQQMRRQLMG